MDSVGTVNFQAGREERTPWRGAALRSIPTFEAERQLLHHESDLLQAFSQGIARFGLACSMHSHAFDRQPVPGGFWKPAGRAGKCSPRQPAH